MELTYESRESGKKSEVNRIRREGGIVAVLYSRGKPGKNIIINDSEFQKLLKSIPKQTLSSRKITLKSTDGGEDVTVIVKGIEYDVMTYNVIHLDFLELHEDVEVTLNIPLKSVGAMDCAGVKLGGSLRQILDFVKVRTLPKNIPLDFEIDVSDLNIGQSKRLRVLTMPAGVRALTDLGESAFVVTKR